MTIETVKQLITVDEYYRRGYAGEYGDPDTRTELIEGEVIIMPPIGPAHAGIVDSLADCFWRRVGDRAIVRVQNPVRLSLITEPQPDLTLLRPRPTYYTDRHPEAGDTLLMVEVAHHSVSYDRGRKLPLYARYGVPEVWIVLVQQQAIEAYADLRDGRYHHHHRASASDVLTPQLLPGVTIAVTEVFRTT